MTILSGKTYDITLFSWEKEKRRFVAEASDLQLKDFDRIYEDESDIGIRIKRPSTGVIVAWFVAKTIRDGEGDTHAWVLHPIAEHAQQYPKLLGVEVVILND
jgi:hypothetical protein